MRRDPKLMELRDRLLTEISVVDDDRNLTQVDVGALVRRLLLFEELILYSPGMRDLPALITAFGSDGLIQLIDSQALAVRIEAWTMGEWGDLGVPADEPNRKPLPLNTYAISSVMHSNREKDKEKLIHEALGEIRGMTTIGPRSSQRLRRALVGALVPIPEGAGQLTHESLPNAFIENVGLVHRATQVALERKLGAAAGNIDFSLQVEQLANKAFAVKTDISQRFSLSPEKTDGVVQDGLLAVAEINRKFEEMVAFNATMGFKPNEREFLSDKLIFLLKQIESDAQEERFARVLELVGLPDPEVAEGAIDVDRLLEIRQTDELREFRQWIRTFDSASDEEIADRVRLVRERVARVVHSGRVKTARLVVTTGLGFIPGIGVALGPAASALDQLIVDKLVPEPGPVSFLSTLYPSIYEH
jgi:hypothetical protein